MKFLILFVVFLPILCFGQMDTIETGYRSNKYKQVDGKLYRVTQDEGAVTTQRIETQFIKETLSILPGLFSMVSGFKPDKTDKVKNLERLLDLYAKSNKKLKKSEITQEQWQSINDKADNFKH